MDSQNLLCFLDIETTGHDPLKLVGKELLLWHEIIEIGAVIANPLGLNIKGEFAVKVKPEYPERCLADLVNDYPGRALAGEWDEAISLTSAIERLFHFCSNFGDILIPAGQNFFFDWSFLSVAFAWCGMEESDWRKILHYSKIDTRSMAVQELLISGEAYDPKEYSFRNEILAKRLGIPMESYPHSALNGARQAYLVFKRLRELREVGDGLR